MGSKIAVVGGGISGLSAALFALESRHAVTLFESAGALGGLASGFDFDGLFIERYYHFVCGGDSELVSLAARLGIGGRLKFRPTKLSFYYNGRFYAFGTPFNLLRFTPISLAARIKFGLNVVTSKYSKNWQGLDGISAKEWLTRRIGEKAYHVIWHPLLKVKFGDFHDRISAAWIWHRIHRVATSRKGIFSAEKLGYFEGGTETLIAAIADKIRGLGGVIRLETGVSGLDRVQEGFLVRTGAGGEPERFDQVVLAVPLPAAAKIVERVSPELSRSLGSIDFIGVVCGLFRLDRPLSEAFWLNINDPRVPANGLIEYTNLNPLKGVTEDRIVYVPFYLPTTDPWYRKGEEALREGFTGILKTLRPDLDERSIRGFRVFKSPHAQAICTVGFKDRTPPVATPVEGLYLLDSTQLYPSDRSLSALIGLATRLAERYFR